MLKNKHSLLFTVLTGCFFTFFTARAKEGMWIPATLKTQEAQLRALGLALPISQLYNEDGTALNNAVVLFGRGCTGEIISGKGLLLTNHHCGYGTVQGLADTINDYFAKGFFATSINDEKPCPGLTVTFIRRIENVTDRVTSGFPDTLSDDLRDTLVMARIKAIEADYKRSTGLDAQIKPYFEGNQYWVALTETFRDIRLVGFPPNGIGQFGGDDENWVWPRHTGDFSVFRVYAGKDNKPAAYSASNEPYRSDVHFKINTSGYREGDMTMVYGFPGTTNEYISSYELDQVYSIYDPISIAARTKKLDVWSRHMNADRNVFIQYTSKRAGIANGWKKWQGEVKGLTVNHAVQKKKLREAAFSKWALTNKAPHYSKHILPELKSLTTKINPLLMHDICLREYVLAVELIQQGSALEQFQACFRGGLTSALLRDTLKIVAARQVGFFKNYDQATDQDLFSALIPEYMRRCGSVAPEYFTTRYRVYGSDGAAWANYIFSQSVLTSEERLKRVIAFARPSDSVIFLNDPAWQLYSAVATLRKTTIAPAVDSFRTQKRYWNRLYIKSQMAQQPNQTYYPDANLTLRLAYGQVKGLDPEGPATYSYQTTLKQAVALDQHEGKDWYRVPPRLKELYKEKQFGRWASANDVPLAFVATNHTSGGNSGSPVLNKRGELIGTNFDRAYEGTMSDYLFDINRCRNITVDIRYTLFIIEKFGGAGWLIDELDLVK